MRQSQLFPKTSKTVPRDASTVNHQLLVRAGFVDQLMAGSWTLLPLGWRVIEKINQIIREEMNAIGGQEMLMPLMHPKEIWAQTERWEKADEVMFKITGKQATEGKEYGLAFTHEEIVLDLVRKKELSYRNLPLALYHFSTKFRNEMRTQGGVLRGREFLMKDMYSLHASEEDLRDFYEKCKQAYLRIFKRVGVEVVVVEASGGIFTTNHTHEFQVVCDVGEDTIYYDPETKTGFNKEIYDAAKGELVEARAVEVGNIFPFGTYYSEKMGVNFMDKDGRVKPVYFGSYGIGQTRLMGVVVEVHHDERGIVWPEGIAPYKYHLLSLGSDAQARAGEIYEKLTTAGQEVLWDDREVSAGEKFADADLLGIPYRLVVSSKTGEGIEIKERREEVGKNISLDGLLSG